MGGRDRGDRGGLPRNGDDVRGGGREGRIDDGNDDRGDGDDDRGGSTPIPALEWVIAGVGLCLVVACLGYLAHRGLTHEPSPPKLAVRVESVAADGGGHHVRFRVENHGGEAAAQIVVRGELVGGGEAETSEVTIDSVAPDAERSGGLYFRRDPARGTLAVHAVGYQDP